jgi:hypothetical protein
MIYIVVNDDQAKLISESPDGIEIRDSSGRHLGYVAHDFTDTDLALAKSRLASSQQRFETKAVIEQLRAMEVK